MWRFLFTFTPDRILSDEDKLMRYCVLYISGNCYLPSAQQRRIKISGSTLQFCVNFEFIAEIFINESACGGSDVCSTGKTILEIKRVQFLSWPLTLLVSFSFRRLCVRAKLQVSLL